MFPEISVSVYLIYECYRLTYLHTYILTELLLEVLADLKKKQQRVVNSDGFNLMFEN